MKQLAKQRSKEITKNADTKCTCKVPAPTLVPTIVYQSPKGTVPYAPNLRKIAPCTYAPNTESVKSRHEAVYIEQHQNRKAVCIPFEVVDHTICNQGSSLKRSMKSTSETAMSLKLAIPPSVIRVPAKSERMLRCAEKGRGLWKRVRWAEPTDLYKQRLHVHVITPGFIFAETRRIRWLLQSNPKRKWIWQK